MSKRNLVLVAAFLLPGAAAAQTVTGIAVEPAQIRPGETAQVTVSFEVDGPINCGLRIHFGDGNFVDYKINQQKDVPLVVPRVYASAGEYRIMAEPKTVPPIMRCSGRNQGTMVRVVAPAAGPAATSKAAAAGPQCPAGWTLDRKSVTKAGAFTCRAAPGTRAVKLTCPGDLGYFENVKRGVMGCQP